MPEALPFRRLASRSVLAHALLVIVVVLATLQAGLLISAGLQVLRETEDKLEFHFRRLDGALKEQERFLQRWRLHDTSPSPNDSSLSATASNPPWSMAPFFASWALVQAPGSSSQTSPRELAERFLRFYGSFWAESSYVAPQCMLVDGAGRSGILVPVTGNSADRLQGSPSQLEAAVTRIHRTVVNRPQLKEGQILWVPIPWLDGQSRLLAISYAPQDKRLWAMESDEAFPSASCLLDTGRVDDFREALGRSTFSSLSLFDAEGTRLFGLAEDTPRPGASALGVDRRGLVYRVHNDRQWIGVYHIAWGQLVGQARAPLLASAIVALLLAAGGVILLGTYRRSVVEPMRLNQTKLLESEAFSRAVLEHAPIGLCLLRRSDGAVMLDNERLRDWLGGDYKGGGWVGAWRQAVCAEAHGSSGSERSYRTPEQRDLLVSAADVKYRGESAVLCLFIDLSTQREAERLLQKATSAADSANRAKSMFLATMSHEIRTPLYGVLGTLELLGLTPLNPRQHEYLQTIQHSSVVLMQIISDILDLSKAEAGQLRLEAGTFDPVLLTEDTVAAWAGAARQKGLQCYACIDADAPKALQGDAARIRQVLNNLLSNAVKFTDIGRVVVRMTRFMRDERQWLQWQVTDTGIGIADEHQVHLFGAFYQASPSNDGQRGAGLGLSICAHLVAIMGGDIRLVSESGLGSSFTFELPLPSASSESLRPAPARLACEVAVLVRGPVRELVQSITARLCERGAAAMLWKGSTAPEAEPDTVMLDLELEDSHSTWPGPHVIASSDAGLPEYVGGAWHVTLHRLDAIVAAIASANGQPLPAAARGSAQPVEHLGLQVLVAEDNPVNQAILREQLEQLGCQAVVASDGREALDYWGQRPFDAIITDLNMPRLDGHALTRALRERGVRVPIIGATANADPAEHDRCVALGMEALLVKPITLRALQEVLEPAVRGAQMSPEEPSAPASRPSSPEEVLHIAPHMRELFVQSMREDLRTLRDALDAAQATTISQVLHRIRGALVVVGATTLADAGLSIEGRLKSGASVIEERPNVLDFISRLSALLEPLGEFEANPPHLMDGFQ